MTPKNGLLRCREFEMKGAVKLYFYFKKRLIVFVLNFFLK